MRNSIVFLFVSSLAVLSAASPAVYEMPLLVDYYNQEQIAVATIDANKSTVRETHRDFQVAEVVLNGSLVCSDKGDASSCRHQEVISSRSLNASDLIQVTVKTGPMALGKGLRITFEKAKGTAFGSALRIRRDTSRD